MANGKKRISLASDAAKQANSASLCIARSVHSSFAAVQYTVCLVFKLTAATLGSKTCGDLANETCFCSF